MTDVTLNFEGFAAGTVIDDEYADKGVRISTVSYGSRNHDPDDGKAMIFDTSHPTGGDHDLATSNLGNALIISEDGDNGDPDDEACGGKFIFEFDEPVTMDTMTVLDVEEGAKIKLFDEDGHVLKTVTVYTADNGQKVVDLGDTDGVAKMTVELYGSGAIDNVSYTLPGGELDGTVEGTAGDDVIDVDYEGDPEGDKIDNMDAILPGAAPNDDLVVAGAGNDLVKAGEGDDEVYGGEGDDDLRGEAGNDVLYGDSDLGTEEKTREVLEWSKAGVGDGHEVSGFTQDTGNVTVTVSVSKDNDHLDIEYEGDDAINVDGVDTGGLGAVNDNSSLQFESNSHSEDGTVTLDFSDEVHNVSFRIADLDFDASFSITAFDAHGNEVPVAFVNEGKNIDLEDEDGDGAIETAEDTNNGGGQGRTSPDNSVGVEIAGPVSKIVLSYDAEGGKNSVTNVSDIYFDTLTVVDPVTGSGNDTLDGGEGDDTMFGEGGDDRIIGGDGNDVAFGGAGDDYLDDVVGSDQDNAGEDEYYGGDGNDRIYTGLGNDTAYGDAGNDLVSGEGGDDLLFGGEGDDQLIGAIGDDTLDGGEGDDRLHGGRGDDSLIGGAGNDEIEDRAGSDSVSGGDGDDFIDVSGETPALDPGFPSYLGAPALSPDANPTNDLDTVDGGAGNDTIFTGDDADSITGGSGDDFIDAGIDDDSVDAGTGNDTVIGGHGEDVIEGGEGDDLIYGGLTTDALDLIDDTGNPALDDPLTDDNRDTVFGGAGDDTVFGRDDDDTLFGGDGNDTLDGGIDEDRLLGEAGDDTLIGGQGNDYLDGGDGDDVMEGGDGDDRIIGGAGNDVAFGGDGNDDMDDVMGSSDDNPDDDEYYGGAGDDQVFTGFGNDTAYGDAGNDTVAGEDGNDTVFGGDGDDRVLGGSGNDTMFGGDGNDRLNDGNDDDEVYGGDGNDVFGNGRGADSLFGDFGDDTFLGGNGGDVVIGGEDPDDEDVDVLDLTGSGVVSIDRKIDVGDGEDDVESGLVTFDDGTTMVYREIETVIPCFTPGTRIATPRGEVLVEELKVGDRIVTRDNGLQEIRWVGHKRFTGRDMAMTPHLRPVLIKAGSLGGGLPERDMMVSPNHRLLVTGEKPQLYFEETEVLVAAKHLVGKPGVHRVDVAQTTYVHFMFDRHEVVLSDGAWTESFQPGDWSLKGIDAEQRAEIMQLFPDLAEKRGLDSYTAARMALKKHEARLLVD